MKFMGYPIIIYIGHFEYFPVIEYLQLIIKHSICIA